MVRLILLAAALAGLAAPAHATQGIACLASDDSGVAIALGSGTIPAPTWWAHEERDDGWSPLKIGMHWIDDETIRVMFVADDGTSRAGELHAERTGDWHYEGWLERDGKRTPMRCEFS